MKFFWAPECRNFRLFIAGQATSNIGNMMHQVATSWLAYELTDSAFILAVVTFSKQLAAFFTGFFSGVVADRFNKKSILQYTHALIAVGSFLLAIFVMLELETVFWLIFFQLVLGLIKGMEMPSTQAFVNDLIPDKKYLINAIALNSTVFNSARVVGPAFAGVVIPFAGEEICFLVYGFMSIVIVIFFIFIKPQAGQTPKKKLDFKAEFFEGASYAFGFPPIKVSLLFVGAFTFVGVSFTVLLPVLTVQVFNKGSEVFGYMTGASGLGAIIGGVYLANRLHALGIERLIFLAAGIFSVGLLAVSISKILAFTIIALAFISLGRVIVFAGTNTLLQTVAEDDKRGRVLSLYISIFLAGVTSGGLLIGALADWIGVLPTLFIEGILCLVICGIYVRKSKIISSDGLKNIYNAPMKVKTD